MPRTKGSKNKKAETPIEENVNIEPVEKKRRGRQPGQVIEREPAVIVELSNKYRVKIDKYNKILQEKGKSESEEDSEDTGWKNIGYFGKWEHIFKTLVDELTRQKAKKETPVAMERYLEIFKKNTEKVNKMFASLDETTMSK